VAGPGKIERIDDLEGAALAQVWLVASTPAEIRLRVWDPDIHPAHAPFELVFEGPVSFSGEEELSDVRFRTAGACEIPGGTLFEFVGEELVPTEGRAIQAAILPDGELRVSHGRHLEIVRARVVARAVSILPARGDRDAV